MSEPSSTSLGRLILLADLPSLPDELLQRVVRDAARPLQEIRHANAALLATAQVAVTALQDLGLQEELARAAEASVIFIRRHEALLPRLPQVFQTEGRSLQDLAQDTRLAVLAAQNLRSQSAGLGSSLEKLLKIG